MPTPSLRSHSAAQLAVPAPAKLNLFLHITGRRADGYHSLQTLFQLLDYGDIVNLQATRDQELRMAHSLPGVADQDNLALRAAQLLQAHSGTAQGAIIGLDKRLPMGGGLGGGSSNAASTLLGLNRLWELDLSLDELAALGLALGADVPVFVRGQNSLAEGVGEQLYPVELPEKWFLVVAPRVNISTAAIFTHPQLTRDSHAIRIAAFFETTCSPVSLADVLAANGIAAQQLRNDCEALVRRNYAEVERAFNWLGQHADPALTGTGSCLYASFASQDQAQQVQAKLPDWLPGFVSHSSQRSSAHRALGL